MEPDKPVPTPVVKPEVTVERLDTFDFLFIALITVISFSDYLENGLQSAMIYMGVQLIFLGVVNVMRIYFKFRALEVQK